MVACLQTHFFARSQVPCYSYVRKACHFLHVPRAVVGSQSADKRMLPCQAFSLRALRH